MSKTYTEIVPTRLDYRCQVCDAWYPYCNCGRGEYIGEMIPEYEERVYPSFAVLEAARKVVENLIPRAEVRAVYEDVPAKILRGDYSRAMGHLVSRGAVTDEVTAGGWRTSEGNPALENVEVVHWAIQWTIDRDRAGQRDPLGHTVTYGSVTVYVAETVEFSELREALEALSGGGQLPEVGTFHS